MSFSAVFPSLIPLKISFQTMVLFCPLFGVDVWTILQCILYAALEYDMGNNASNI